VLPNAGYLISVGLALVAAGAVFLVWVANRKRIAAETVGRAEEQALRILKDAARDADNSRKETLLDAKEKAHDILTDADRQARQERQQAHALEQSVTRRDAQLTERQLSFERMEKELLGRETTIAQREQQAEASAATSACCGLSGEKIAVFTAAVPPSPGYSKRSSPLCCGSRSNNKV